ncbi:MAG: UDP-3-O-(3-hydroxymyristoyl)glucosamine N-acyltransferase [Sedimentisphaerales bacterium]|nr:UDP-3-O-(3-hydroxymyristoyl)glucosamine N-acyltransferase [Sedimentisphaerales bacterium]
MRTRTLEELAKHVGGTIHGDPKITVSSVATMESAQPGDITFYSNAKYEFQLKTTKASAVIVSEEIESNAALLIADDPYYAFMQIVVLIYGHRKHKQTGISKKASISESAKIGKNCNIADFATISDNAKIGDNCTIYPGAFIGPDVTLGSDCIIYPNAVIYNNCIIGSRVIIHSNASIGQDGFGFATHQGVHLKIPQVGIVIIEDDVEIGAAACIERATLGETIVCKGTKIGDMVAVGHGTKVGEHCLLVPQVGIAGSVTLGHHVALGGQAGIAGHITIGNMVQVGAKSGLSNNVPDGKVLLGIPAMDANKTKRIYGTLPQLPDMRRKIKQLEKKLAKLEKNEG